MHWKDILENRYALAIFTAGCGFVFALILERIKAKRAPRKAISWDATIEKAPRLNDKDETSKVGISYDGRLVKDLVQIYVRFENTGNTVLKNEYIRFRFPTRARILEVELDPFPERELGVTEVRDPDLSGIEKRYKISHLEAGQSVRFRVVSDGGAWLGWSDIHPFNEEGDVLFQRRDVARAKADEDEVEPFIWSSVLLLLLLLLASASASGQIGSIILLLVAIPLSFYISVKVPKVIRVMRRALSPLDLPRQIYLDGAQGVQIGENNAQTNSYRRPNLTEEDEVQ